MKLLIGLLILSTIIFASSLNWRRSVKALFFIVVFEGALRKWVLPQASELIYFLKDLVLLGAYLNYFAFSGADKKNRQKKSILNIFIFIVTGWCLFQAFNPSLGSPIAGVLGVKAYVFYIPLIWMLPNLFESEEELQQFLRSHLLLVIPTGIIGIVQFFSPSTSPINAYAPGEVSNVATFGFGAGAAVRITGTFSYINSYTGYLLVCFGLLISLLTMKQSLWWRSATIVELFLVTINAFMTGSRTLILGIVLFLMGYLGIKALAQPASLVRFIKQFSFPAIVGTVLAFIGFRSAIEQFQRRATSNRDLSGRILGIFVEPLEFMKYKELDGYGTGATHPGTLALRRIFNLPSGESIPVYYESEMGRVALELGPIGFLLWYGLRISLAIALWLVFWRLKRPFLRQLALAAFLIHLIQFSGQMVFHHTFSVYYWFLSSFIFLLPRLEEIENWHEEQLLLEQNAFFSHFSDSSYK